MGAVPWSWLAVVTTALLLLFSWGVGVGGRGAADGAAGAAPLLVIALPEHRSGVDVASLSRVGDVRFVEAVDLRGTDLGDLEGVVTPSAMYQLRENQSRLWHPAFNSAAQVGAYLSHVAALRRIAETVDPATQPVCLVVEDDAKVTSPTTVRRQLAALRAQPNFDVAVLCAPARWHVGRRRQSSGGQGGGSQRPDKRPRGFQALSEPYVGQFAYAVRTASAATLADELARHVEVQVDSAVSMLAMSGRIRVVEAMEHGVEHDTDRRGSTLAHGNCRFCDLAPNVGEDGPGSWAER